MMGEPVARAGVTALQTIGGIHRHRAHPVVAEILLNFEDQGRLAGACDLDGLEESRDFALGELDVHHTAQDLHHTAGCVSHVELPPLQLPDLPRGPAIRFHPHARARHGNSGRAPAPRRRPQYPECHW